MSRDPPPRVRTMTSIARVFVVMAFGVSVRHSAVRRRDDTAPRGAHDDAEDHGGCDHGHCHGHGRGRDAGSRRRRRARARSVASFVRVVVVVAFGVGVRCLAVPLCLATYVTGNLKALPGKLAVERPSQAPMRWR